MTLPIRPARLAPIVLLTLLATADAQDASLGQPVIIPSQSSVYNQNNVGLPTPPTVYGQDVVRSVDGSSCQSAVASGGPYVDVGLIGSQDVFDRETAAVYGRLVMPLGHRAKRVDCTRLYELEIARMKVELEMLRMGLQGGTPLMPTASGQAAQARQAVPAALVAPVAAPRPIPAHEPPPIEVSAQVTAAKASAAAPSAAASVHRSEAVRPSARSTTLGEPNLQRSTPPMPSLKPKPRRASKAPTQIALTQTEICRRRGLR